MTTIPKSNPRSKVLLIVVLALAIFGLAGCGSASGIAGTTTDAQGKVFGLDLAHPAGSLGKANVTTNSVPSASSQAAGCLPGKASAVEYASGVSYTAPRVPQAVPVNPVADYVAERLTEIHSLADDYLARRLKEIAAESLGQSGTPPMTGLRFENVRGASYSASTVQIWCDFYPSGMDVAHIDYNVVEWDTHNFVARGGEDLTRGNSSYHASFNVEGLNAYKQYLFSFDVYGPDGGHLASSASAVVRTLKVLETRKAEVTSVSNWIILAWKEVERFSVDNRFGYVPDGAQALDELIASALLTEEYLDKTTDTGDMNGQLTIDQDKLVRQAHRARFAALAVANIWHDWHREAELDLIENDTDLPIVLLEQMPTLELVIKNLQTKAKATPVGKVPSPDEALMIVVGNLADDLDKRYRPLAELRWQSIDKQGWNSVATLVGGTYLVNKYYTDELAVRLLSKFYIGLDPASQLGIKVRAARDQAIGLMHERLTVGALYVGYADETSRNIDMNHRNRYVHNFVDKPSPGGLGKTTPTPVKR